MEDVTNYFSTLDLILQADIIVQIVIIILLLMSIMSWGVIFDRWWVLRQRESYWKKFSKAFWSGTDLRKLSSSLASDTGNPFVKLFIEIMREYPSGSDKFYLTRKLETMIQSNLMQLTVSLERRLSWLASISSAAPFIGLLGTVWGIIHAFRDIAATQQSHLAVVAPGIAEALFATALGLFVAIPAVFAYNIFVARKEKLITGMEYLADDLYITVLRHIDKSTAGK